jgi:hypothetical protein
MTPVRQRQFEQSAVAVMALPAPSAWSRLEIAMLNTRDSLMIIGYEYALRVLVFARRWNY